MYTFFAYLILLLHITTRSLADDTDTIFEICDYFDQYVDHTAVIAVTIDAAAQDQSIKCEQRFSVTISTQEQAENYLIFEVQAYSQDPDFYTVLLTDTQQAPKIWYNDTQRIINETYDVNAYVYRKSYQHITYTPSQLAVGKTIYFNVYNLPIQDGTTLASAVYSISVRSTPTYPCPQNCGGNGNCDENLEQCVCSRGYFDEDCTVQATEITENQAGYDISVGDNQFFFYEILDISDDLNNLQLYYVKTEGSLNIAYSINQYNDFYLPNYDGDAYRNPIDNNAEDDYFNIFQQSLSYGSFVLLEVTNVDPSNTVTFQVRVNEFYDPPINRVTMMVIFIGVFCFLVFAWGVLTLVKFKIHRQVETLLQARNPNGQEQRDLLSKEDIDKFFKKKKYKETQCSFPQNTCSICLEDFHGESVCRQLYCEHVYHATCIESWLSQHTSCPNCKKEMTKSAIEEYLASPKLLDDKAEEEMENEGNNGIRIGLPRTLAPLEEEKDDHAPRSLHDIIIQQKDGKNPKKLSESLTGAPLERSMRGTTPKYLEARGGFMNRKIDEMYRKNTQDPMDFEERDVREKADIGLRMDQKKSRNISEINPLNRRSIASRDADADEEE